MLVNLYLNEEWVLLKDTAVQVPQVVKESVAVANWKVFERRKAGEWMIVPWEDWEIIMQSLRYPMLPS